MTTSIGVWALAAVWWQTFEYCILVFFTRFFYWQTLLEGPHWTHIKDQPFATSFTCETTFHLLSRLIFRGVFLSPTPASSHGGMARDDCGYVTLRYKPVRKLCTQLLDSELKFINFRFKTLFSVFLNEDIPKRNEIDFIILTTILSKSLPLFEIPAAGEPAKLTSSPSSPEAVQVNFWENFPKITHSEPNRLPIE